MALPYRLTENLDREILIIVNDRGFYLGENDKDLKRSFNKAYKRQWNFSTNYKKMRKKSQHSPKLEIEMVISIREIIETLHSDSKAAKKIAKKILKDSDGEIFHAPDDTYFNRSLITELRKKLSIKDGFKLVKKDLKTLQIEEISETEEEEDLW